MNRTQGRLKRLESAVQRQSKLLRLQEVRAETLLRETAVLHGAAVAAIVAYGDPQITEPLTDAWRRFAEKFPRSNYNQFSPFSNNKMSARLAGITLRTEVIPKLPGADEKERLNRIFASAPAWLMWFTYGDFTASVLQLELPDLSSVKRFDRQTAFIECWPALPTSVFEQRPWPDGGGDEPPPGPAEIEFMRRELGIWTEGMTPRQRRRALISFVRSKPIEHDFEWPKGYE
jgi:hypothetical protein